MRKFVDTANAAWVARKQKQGHSNELKSPAVMLQTAGRPSHDGLMELALQIDLASALCLTATEVDETDDAQTMAKVLIGTLRNSSAKTYDSNLMRSIAYGYVGEKRWGRLTGHTAPQKTAEAVQRSGSRTPALPADLESLEPHQLKEALEARNLDVTGERPQLLNRLQEYEARDNADDDSGGGGSSGDDGSDAEQYGGLSDDDDIDGSDGSGAGSDDAAHEKERSGEMGRGLQVTRPPADAAIVGLVLRPMLATALSKVARQQQQKEEEGREDDDGKGKRQDVALQLATALEVEVELLTN